MYQERYWQEQMFATVDELRGVAEECGVPLTTLACNGCSPTRRSRPRSSAPAAPSNWRHRSPPPTPRSIRDVKARLDDITAIYRQGDHDR